MFSQLKIQTIIRYFFLIGIMFILFNNNAEANCNVTISEDTTQGSLDCADNQTMTVNEGISWNSTAQKMIDVEDDDGFTLINNGTIDSTTHNMLYFADTANSTIENNGTINGRTQVIIINGTRGDFSITNTGTISSENHAAISSYESVVSGNITINNSGLITAQGINSGQTTHNPSWIGLINLGHCSSDSHEEHCTGNEGADGTGSYTVINTGRMEQERRGVFALRFNNKVNNTITTSGTIFGGPEEAFNVGSSGSSRRIGMDIMVIKCDDTAHFDSCGASGSGKTTINIEKGAQFRNGIDFNGTKGEIVIGAEINRDLEIRIFDYVQEHADNLTITNNSGHEVTLTEKVLTFSNGDNNVWGNITPSRAVENAANRTKNHSGRGDEVLLESAEYYNAGIDGILIVKGERLEVNLNSHKYRAQNTLSKFKNFYNAVDGVGFNEQRCTTLEENRNEEEFKDCNTGFVKIFNSSQRRENVYKAYNYGGVGMYSPMILTDNLVSNAFFGYSQQNNNFDDQSGSYNDNFTLGLKSSYQNSGFEASLTPLIGVSLQKQSDYDTDKTELRTKNFLSEFAGLNGKILNTFERDNNRSILISLESSFSAQRYPEYSSQFTDGTLKIKESVDKLLSNTLEISHTTKIPEENFLSKLYVGGSAFKNYNDKIEVSARGFNSDVSNEGNQEWSGYHAGLSIGKKTQNLNYELDLRYEDQEGLMDRTIQFSVNKQF